MIDYPIIDPVAVSLGPLKVHWYGLTYLGGLLFAWWMAGRRTERADSPIARAQVDDLIFYAAVGIIVGGRLGYVLFYGFDRWLDDPMWLFRVWEGGMAFHGGLIGVVTALWVFGRRHNIAFAGVADFVAPPAPTMV